MMRGWGKKAGALARTTTLPRQGMLLGKGFVLAWGRLASWCWRWGMWPFTVDDRLQCPTHGTGPSVRFVLVVVVLTPHMNAHTHD